MQQPVILLVDDDDSFKFLVKHSLDKAGLNAALQYCWNGEEAIHYLCRRWEFTDETAYPWPSLVLLDVKMPWVNGFEVLEWKSMYPGLVDMPFAVLTSYYSERDKQRALELGAASYLSKPATVSGLIEMLRSFEPYLHPEAMDKREPAEFATGD
jgi:CheY-like chemotaxis protein